MPLRVKRKAKKHQPVDKSQLLHGEPERVRSRAYLDLAPKMKCAACPNDAQVAAHIRTGNRGGTGLKPGDDCIEWLCSDCHSRQESNPGAGWWFENVKQERTTLSAEDWLNQVYIPKRKTAYQEWEKGRR